MNKTTMTAAMALLVVLTLSQAPLGLGNPTVSNVKFRLTAYDNVKISFSESIIADAITLTSENITLENLQTASGSYTAPSQFFSVENADMTIDTLENDNVEFDLDASTGVESLATMTDGGRGEPEGVELNNVSISEKASLGDLHAADNGWYFDNSDNTIYVKTTHSSMNSIYISWESEEQEEREQTEVSPTIQTLLMLIPTMVIIGLILLITRFFTDKQINSKDLIGLIVIVVLVMAMLQVIITLI